MKWIYKILLFIIFISVAESSLAWYQDRVNLKGEWMFRVGDRMEWATNEYDDSDWDRIRVPSHWEDQGFHGYDGYAWYRIRVVIPESYEGKEVVLNMGYIDDVDEVYINGTKIGQTGSFPPHYYTAYNAKRQYRLSSDVIRLGEENLIAVRVYDAGVGGGLISGDFSIETKGEKVRFDIDLTGEWMFNRGRRIEESEAKPILVPGLWENQGFYKYDGYAVYFKKVFISEELASEKLVLMAGRIDDNDQFYLNGEFIAGTGAYYPRTGATSYQEFRNYFIPSGRIIPGQENLIEIRVYDKSGGGGIEEGPVGIVTQEKFRNYWNSKRVY